MTSSGPSGARGLERSRQALLSFLAASIEPEELPRTIVVFDAQDAPPGLPRAFQYKGLAVRFAPRHGDADTLIEELIRLDTTPRRLTVVSSDHRLQRAAKRRRAQAVDSDVWYAQVIERRRRQREQAAGEATAPQPPAVPLLEEDVEYWLRQFGEPRVFETGTGSDAANPFPPGYGDDLEEKPKGER
jgi:uncharacterized protein